MCFRIGVPKGLQNQALAEELASPSSSATKVRRTSLRPPTNTRLARASDSTRTFQRSASTLRPQSAQTDIAGSLALLESLRIQ